MLSRRRQSAAPGADSPIRLTAEEEARLERLLASDPAVVPKEPRG
jgi:hypothetical protein